MGAPDRLSVLAVDHDPDVVRGISDLLRGQPIELRTCDDAAEALLVLGRTSPDVVLLGPASGRLDPVDFITIARGEDPGVPILAGAGGECAEFAARATAAGATAVIPRPYRGPELLALLRSLAPRPEQLRMRPYWAISSRCPRPATDGISRTGGYADIKCAKCAGQSFWSSP